MGKQSFRKEDSLLNWRTVCMSKVKGGLDIRSLAPMNEALLGKWAWRFVEEENSA